MRAEPGAVYDGLVSAAINGMGQGLLAILLLAACFKIFRRTNAATRHALEFWTLLLLAALVGVQAWVAGAGGGRQSGMAGASAGLGGIESPMESVTPGWTAEELERTESAAEAVTEEAAARPAPKADWEERLPGGAAAEEPGDAGPRTLALPANVTWGLAALWCVVSGVRLISLAVQLLRVRRWKNEGENAPEAARELFSRLCVELNVSRAPQLRMVREIAGPMVVGFRSPAVLAPASLCENAGPEKLEQIFRHELAHVLRWDDWVNLVQRTVEALLFFHPGIAWLSRRMTVDREIACDDYVLSGSRDRKAYALSLAEFASRSPTGDLIAAPGAWSKQSQLKQRIDMILDTKRNTSPRLARGRTGIFAVAALLAALLGFQAAPRLALAQATPDAPPAEPAETAPTAPAAPSAAPAPAALPAPEAHADVHVQVHPRFAPEGGPRIKARRASDGSEATIAFAPAGGGAGGQSGTVSIVTSDSADSAPQGEGEAPRVKKSRARTVDDSLERRLDRLEKLVQTLVRRDVEEKKFQFDFHNKFDGNFNADDLKKMHEDAARQMEKATRQAEKAMKDMQNRGDFGPAMKQGKEIAENWNLQRKVLEEQKQALERQVHALERQIEKMEHEKEQIVAKRERDDEKRSRDEEKRSRDEKRREREDRDTGVEKEKP